MYSDRDKKMGKNNVCLIQNKFTSFRQYGGGYGYIDGLCCAYAVLNLRWIQNHDIDIFFNVFVMVFVVCMKPGDKNYTYNAE